ncbi:hypothetical protein [Streptomyces abyssomicinicus]|uniref:hypothetical protein n=1 Tax=Streptomyces abyssomicinicus TaxID=574929 RepID=UPI0012505CBA|nr:hypothetical protein [Streptomyces abyssomicinicus]
MAAGEDLLWDARDKGMQMVPRLWRLGVTAGVLGFLALLLLVDSHAVWALYAGALYLIAEIVYWAWDRGRLVEARIVAGEDEGTARIRLRRVGGRISEHDPRRVTRVLVIHDNVLDQAALRLRVHKGRLLFGRPGRAPALAAWRQACPNAEVGDRAARWGMPGVPD